MPQVKHGDTVSVHYTGSFPDGEVFDSSENKEPLEFTVGAGHVIKGFDQGVLGMEPGDKKRIEIAAADAYGERREDMIITIGRDQVPDDVNPEVGDMLEMRDNMGHRIPVVITEITDENIKLDANSPLAGKDLVFDIELVDIK